MLVVRVEKGRLSCLCGTWDGDKISKLSSGLSSLGRSGRLRNCSAIWLAVGRCDVSWTQQASIICHTLSVKPRDNKLDGRAGLSPLCTAHMTRKSCWICMNGNMPENIWSKFVEANLEDRGECSLHNTPVRRHRYRWLVYWAVVYQRCQHHSYRAKVQEPAISMFLPFEMSFWMLPLLQSELWWQHQNQQWKLCATVTPVYWPGDVRQAFCSTD